MTQPIEFPEGGIILPISEEKRKEYEEYDKAFLKITDKTGFQDQSPKIWVETKLWYRTINVCAATDKKENLLYLGFFYESPEPSKTISSKLEPEQQNLESIENLSIIPLLIKATKEDMYILLSSSEEVEKYNYSKRYGELNFRILTPDERNKFKERIESKLYEK